jgi:putative ABC transport system permease protein
LTESLLLGLAGSALGALLSLFGTRLLLVLAPPIPRLEGVEVNAWVLLFSVVAGAITSLAVGMAPALQLAGAGASETLVRGRRVAGGRSRFLHQAVVSGEIALTVLLLVGGGLLTKSLIVLLDVDTGFQQEGLIEARVSLPSYLLPEGTQRRQAYLEIMDALAAIPGVTGVSGTSRLPFSGRMNTNGIQVIGQTPTEEGRRPTAERRRVYPGFYRTMGMPLLRGRDFTEADRGDTPKVAIISQAMARRFWPGQDPLGARFIAHDTFSVVGMVGDVRHESLRSDPLPTFYLADAQQAIQISMSLVIRTARVAESLLPEIREAVRRIHSQAPIIRLASAPSLVSESVREERFRAILFAVFASAAVLLAAAGVFGVTARGVENRKAEMGIRMALGAQRGSLMRLTLLPGLSAGLIGLCLGLLAALGTSRLLAGFLFGVEPWDPATYGIVGFTVLGVSLAATYLPSRRIEKLEPATILREE